MLPRPPPPPRATTASAPAWSRSASRLPPGSSKIAVPTGTRSVTLRPAGPSLRALAPCLPSSARKRLRETNSWSEESCGSATTTTDPPRPPSPPSGPPRGMNGSRRNDAEPRPPSPARTLMRALSTKAPARRAAFGLGGLDGDAPAIFANALVHDLPRAEREERVVATLADALAGADAGAALPDDDHARD